MSGSPYESLDIHTRLLKCALQVEDSRAYWTHATAQPAASANTAFNEYWFGAKSLRRVKVLLTSFRSRFDAFPPSLHVLAAWHTMPPRTRTTICHWHLQLSDPLYRQFSGVFLPERIDAGRPTIQHAQVVDWVGDQGKVGWSMTTRRQFASRLLSCARETGLLQGMKGKMPLMVPRVEDDALRYLLHLLRAVEIDASLLDNPYLRSMGLTGSVLADRLRTFSDVGYSHQAGVVHLNFRHESLRSWAHATVAPSLPAESIA